MDGAQREVGELDLTQNISFLLTWEVKQPGVRARVSKGACSSDHASTTLKIHQNLFAERKRRKKTQLLHVTVQEQSLFGESSRSLL